MANRERRLRVLLVIFFLPKAAFFERLCVAWVVVTHFYSAFILPVNETELFSVLQAIVYDE